MQDYHIARANYLREQATGGASAIELITVTSQRVWDAGQADVAAQNGWGVLWVHLAFFQLLQT